jgi:nitrite reductase (cytochrome c-552)
MREKRAKLVVAATLLLVAGAVASYGLLQQRAARALEGAADPDLWAALFPRQHASSARTALDYGRTEFGGSTPYDKLEANPFRKRAWAGHPFELEYRASRGHHWAQLDQRESRRTTERDQPAACIHCHAAEAPALLADLGWADFHRHRYDELRDFLRHGSSCADCHAPGGMELWISRPAFARALERAGRGEELEHAAPERMRSFVCGQCHGEYYFSGPMQELVFPWDYGLRLEDIERYYDERDFHDWIHAETGAPMIKIQHPEFEMHSTGVHAALGVSCADCHMPREESEGGLVTDHWIRSPLTNARASCLGCHQDVSETEIVERAVEALRRTAALLAEAEEALGGLMDAVSEAIAAGIGDEGLGEARQAHRSAQMRWDFVDAENSTGFHSPGEAARLLLDAAAIAREGTESLARSEMAVED